MRLVVVRETGTGAGIAGTGMLGYAFSTDPLQRLALDGTRRLACSARGQQAVSKLIGRATSQGILWVVPQPWREQLATGVEQTLGDVAEVSIDRGLLEQTHRYPWFAMSDGRFAAHVNGVLLEQILRDSNADVLAVTATPGLLAYQERVRLTQQGELVGYRRLYRDTTQPIPLPRDWPHHLLIKSQYVGTLLKAGQCQDFASVVEKCRACRLSVQAVAIAGFVADLRTPEGWLTLSEMMLKETQLFRVAPNGEYGTPASANGEGGRISPDARVMGPVLLGDDVCVESDAVLIGPSILCHGSTVRKNAVVDSSVVGARAVVECEQTLRNAFVDATGESTAAVSPFFARRTENEPGFSYPRGSSVFRRWPRISYAGCFKRVVDVVVAVIVLLLFIPIIPVMALAIKVSSPGPVFFRDKRQGFHGRLFDCVKFRTMRVGAADIQDKLRFVSEVDGPQFKLADDPRISTVGRFLRETYLDEIPQFFNVLCGDMSVVGPRPSPESENTLCPSWRDARLSVRPGITGLWQVNRTRRPFKDFQEWIYYDTEYVRKLSPRFDLWICWRTFMKMIENFVHQF